MYSSNSYLDWDSAAPWPGASSELLLYASGPAGTGGARRNFFISSDTAIRPERVAWIYEIEPKHVHSALAFRQWLQAEAAG